MTETHGPVSFITVRREITKPCCKTISRSPEELRRTRAGRRKSVGQTRRLPACRNSESAIQQTCS